MLVTGYLSRSFTFTRANLRKLATTVVVPYFGLRDPAGAVPRSSAAENFGVLYVSRHWPMWYLTVLFLWRLATPFLTRLRPAVAMTVPRWRSAGRRAQHGVRTATLGLYQFFVAGLVMTREQFDWLTPSHVRVRRGHC